MESNMITINIKKSAEEINQAKITLNQTVKQLKEQLKNEMEDISINQNIKLIFGGKILKDDEVLGTLNITEGSTLSLVKFQSSTNFDSTQQQQQQPQSNQFGNMFGGGIGGLGFDLSSINIGQIMNNPQFQNVVQNVLQNPSMISQIVNDNPMLQQFTENNPALQQALNDPSILQMAQDPNFFQSMMGMFQGNNNQQQEKQAEIDEELFEVHNQQDLNNVFQQFLGGNNLDLNNLMSNLGQGGQSQTFQFNISDMGGFDINNIMQQFSGMNQQQKPQSQQQATQQQTNQQYSDSNQQVDQNKLVQKLVEMGFTDEEANLNALKQCNGNVQDAAEKLLNDMQEID